MIAIENVNAFVTGVFPDTVADNSTGASTADGFEFIAEYINNSIIGPQQAMMDYAGLTPDGVTESASASQMIEAIQKGNAVGPGYSSVRFIEDIPSVHGDRVLILSEQGVLVATYPELVAKTYVGDAGNAARAAAGGKFYKSSDAGGATPDTAGPWFQLPAQNPTFLKQYLGDGTDFSVTSDRATWTTTDAVVIPYKTSDGAWRLVFNIEGAFTAGSFNSFNLTLSGVTFKAGFVQGVTLFDGLMQSRSADQNMTAEIAGVGITILNSASISLITTFAFSGDVELDSKPTWADDFIYQWGITY